MDLIFGLIGILLLVGAVLGIGLAVMASTDSNSKGASGVFVIGALFLGLLGFGLMGFRVIDAGSVGVLIRAGTFDEDERPPGITWVMPIVDNIIEVDTRIKATPFEKVAAGSLEQQDVFLDGTFNYHIQPDTASGLLRTVGEDYDKKLLVPFFTNIVKEVVARVKIDDVTASRAKIRVETTANLTEKLAPYGIVIDDVAITNISFSEAYNAGIEAKQQAALQVQTERNNTLAAEERARQAKAVAAGEANAAIEKARGEGERTRIQAQADADNARITAQAAADNAKIRAAAEAEANRSISGSLTESLLRLRQLEHLSDKVQIVYLPAGNDPLQLLPLSPIPSTGP